MDVPWIKLSSTGSGNNHPLPPSLGTGQPRQYSTDFQYLKVAEKSASSRPHRWAAACAQFESRVAGGSLPARLFPARAPVLGLRASMLPGCLRWVGVV